MRLRNAIGLAIFCALSAFAAEESHGGGEHGDPLLTSKWINFAILAAGIGYLIVKTAFPAFRAQQKEILDAMDQASKEAAKVAEQARQVDAKIANLNQEVDALRQKAMAEMQNEAKRLDEEAAATMAKIEQSAEAEIVSATKAAKKQLAAKAAELALTLAQRKITDRMNPTLQATLVDRFTANLEKRA